MFRRLNLGPGGTISLFSTDGWLLSRMPERVGDTNRNIASDPPYRAVSPGPADARTGSFEATSLDDGVHRIHVYQRLGAFPMVASIGVSTDAIFTDWLMGAIGVLVLFTLFAFLLGALVWALRQELARRAIAERNARDSAAKLRVTLARLDAWFSNTPDALMLVRVEPGGAFIYEAVNTGFLDTFGIDTAAVLGNGPQAFCPPDTARFLLAKWQECVATRLPMQYTVHLGHLARTTELEVRIAPIFGDDGAVTGIVGGGRDVTERSMVEGRLRQFQKLQLVGQLAAGVAHDFNNLLQAIIGGIDMLDQTASNDPETEQVLSIIRRSAFRGATLTNRLLTVSRQQSLDPALCDTTDLLDEISELCAASLRSIVEITLEKEPGTWPVMVDPTQLTTCLMNLAVNAHHAMPSGGRIVFAARNANASEPGAPDGLVGDYVVLEVRDTGCGMTGAVLEKACDPFFTTKDVGKGTGLGLSMALGFAQQSGGALVISSKPGLGTTVRIWLPRAAADVQSALPSAGGPSKDPRHILLVDDDIEVGPVLRMMLVTAGYAVTLANSGTEALSLIKAAGPADAPFDALVTDYAMPGMNGAELATVVHQHGVSIPILMVTGYHDAAGSDHRLPTDIRILRKPIRYDDLLMQVGALFHAHYPTASTLSPSAGNVVPLRPRGFGSALS